MLRACQLRVMMMIACLTFADASVQETSVVCFSVLHGLSGQLGFWCFSSLPLEGRLPCKEPLSSKFQLWGLTRW